MNVDFYERIWMWAAAVIIANNQPGNFNGSLIGMSSIPVVSVSQDDGSTLRQAIRAGGATVRIEVNATNAQSTGHNVVATRPGGPQTLVIGGHIDSGAWMPSSPRPCASVRAVRSHRARRLDRSGSSARITGQCS